MGEWESGGVGERESGRAGEGEWERGGVGERERGSGRGGGVGERESGKCWLFFPFECLILRKRGQNQSGDMM